MTGCFGVSAGKRNALWPTRGHDLVPVAASSPGSSLASESLSKVITSAYLSC